MVFRSSVRLLSGEAFFKAHEKKRSYGGKALPSTPFSHADYVELAEDYADYVCQYEKYIDADPSRKREERIALLSPEEYEADLKKAYNY